MQVPDIIIAIDGYSSTGKSSFAKLIAKEFSFLYLDSGALYRAVTLYAMEHGMVLPDGSIDSPALDAALPALDVRFEYADGGSHTFIGDECVDDKIRTIEVSSHVSPVSVIPEVRSFVDRKLVEYGNNKRIVMDGRDIGTVVLPDAGLKIFLTASVEARAKRRQLELEKKGKNLPFEEVLRDMEYRDKNDSSRAAAPLRPAEDAVRLDTTQLDFDESCAAVESLIRERFAL